MNILFKVIFYMFKMYDMMYVTLYSHIFKININNLRKLVYVRMCIEGFYFTFLVHMVKNNILINLQLYRNTNLRFEKRYLLSIISLFQ